MPITFDDLDAADARTAQEDQQALRASMLTATQQNPDQYAEAKRLSETTGVPAPVVARNLPEMRQRASLSAYDRLFDDSPVLAERLKDPSFASVAHDDTDNAKSIESIVRPRGVGFLGVSEMIDQLRARNPALDWDTARAIALRDFQKGGYNAGFTAPPPQQNAASAETVVGGTLYSLVTSLKLAEAGAQAEISDAFGFNGGRERALRRRETALYEQQLADPKFESKGAELLYGGAKNVAQNLPILAAALTGNPEIAAALAAVQTQSEAYGRYASRGASGLEALAGSGIEGAIEFATERIPLSFLTENFGKVPFWKLFVGDQAREQITEQIATHTQDLTDALIANPDMTIAQYLKDRPDAALETAVAVLMQGVVIGTAHHAATTIAGKSQSALWAEQQARAITQLNELAKASKLRERDPQSFAHFVDEAAKEGPVQDIFVDANTFAQAAGENLQEIIKQSPSVAAQLDDAMLSGGDIRIPLGEYASTIAASNASEALLPHLRTAPDGMSMDEAKNFMQSQAEEFQKEAERILTESEFDAGFKESAATVEGELLAQLQQTGRFSNDVNQAYAKLMASFYTVQSARIGITPEELYVTYPLTIRAEGQPGSGATLDQQGAIPFDVTAAPQAVAQSQPGAAAPVLGVHFGNTANLQELSGGKYGTGARGREVQRVMAAADQRLRNRVYFYAAPNGTLPRRETGTGGHAYAAQLNNLYNFDTDPAGIVAKTRSIADPEERGNAMESAVLDAGYNGYQAGGAVVVINASPKVKYLGLEADLIKEHQRGQPSEIGSQQTEARGLYQPSRVRGGDLILDVARRADTLNDAPLAGLPTPVTVDGKDVAFGPYLPAREAARRYAERAGLPYNPPRTYAKVNKERARRIAQAFDDMVHAPNDPEVKASYDAMIAETLAQWQVIKETGLVVEFIEGKDPYGNPRNAILDVVNNNHLWVFPTTDGFGGSESLHIDISGNPLLQIVEGETISGKPVRANDIFRIVHDYFGHIKEGNGFRAEGEENAWRIHSAMYSDLARRAMTTETRGQNSWVNFGPYGDFNATANGAETQYAPQKIGLLPTWVSEEGVRDPDQQLYQSSEPHPPFYSELSRQIGLATMKSADGTAWKNYLKNLSQKGVKPDEVKWSGVEEWLDAHEGKITKEEVQQFLDNYGPKVQTRIKGANGQSGAEMDVSFGDWEVDEPDESYLAERAEEQIDEEIEERVDALWKNHEEEAREELGGGLDYEEAFSLLGDLPLQTNAEREQMARDMVANLKEAIENRARELAAEGIDRDELLERLIDQEREWYYEDSESPRTRKITVDVGGKTFTFRNEYSYGENRLYAEEAQVDIGLPRRADDADIEGVIANHLLEYHDVRFGEDEGTGEQLDGQTHADALDAGSAKRGDPDYVTNHDYVVENSYREMLLTLPKGEVGVPRTPRYEGELYEVLDKPGTVVLATVSEQNARREAEAIGGTVRKTPSFGATNRENVRDFYYTTHFDEANIVAHVRFNEIKTPDDKRVMVLQEVQGDWAQQYREAQEAYAREAEIDAEIAKIDAEIEAIFKQQEGRTGDAPPEVLGRHAALSDRKGVLISERSSLNTPRNPPPEGPFTTKTQAWVSLAMKRVIRYAVEEGFDQVVWTTGSQQTLRWSRSLRSRVDAIYWTKTEQGIHLVGYKGNREVVNTTQGENSLSDAIGKTMAKRIIESPMQADTIEGEDIVVADTGMAGFYDKMLPNITKDILKKLDKNAKVRVLDLRSRKTDYAVRHEGENPEEHAAGGGWVVTRNGLPLRTYDGLRGTALQGNPYKGYATQADAEAAAQDMRQKEGDTAIGEQLGFDITDAMRESAMRGQPLFQNGGPKGWDSVGTFDPSSPPQTPRGLFNPSTNTITLLQHADLSTFLHESGHFYLNVLADIASQPDAPKEIVDDMNKLLAWFGVKDLATWNGMTIDEQRQSHEKFARGFETYLFEGKAPSVGLNGLFARFRAWLINLYKSVANLGVELNPEVRGVFDRLIATNEEILAAESARAYAPLFKSAADIGMTDAEWRAYQELGTEPTDEAVAELQSRSLRDMKWLSNARSKMLKDLQRQAEARRKEVREEVTKEVVQEPLYAAMQFLRTGVTESNGETIQLPGGFKLDRAAIEAMYPAGELANVDWQDKLGTGRYGMVGKDGLHPNLVAEMFGFSSGDELVRKLLSARPMKEAVDGLTDQRMLERYGDLSSPQDISTAVDKAIHNEARARFIATELRALAKATGQKNVLSSAAREFADNIVARKKIRDIKPAQFSAAEARAARNAEKAMVASKLAEAAAEKRNQLVNNYATKAAHKALGEVEKGVRYLKDIADSKTIDPEYRVQIEALLDRFDLRKISNKDADRRANLLAWVEDQKAAGFEPVIAPELLNEALRKPYKEMTVEEFRGLVDAVKNIEHLGRLKHKLLTAKDQREFAAVVDEAARSIVDNAKREVPVKLERNSWSDKLKDKAARYFAMHAKFASLVREMDGWRDNGVLWRLFSRPMNAAGDREAVMREQATMRLSELLAPMAKMSEKVYIPAINASLTREGRISVALNTGNEGNLQRLMDGDHWSLAQVRAITDTLTKEDWDFVQSVWDFIGTYRDQIGAQQKRLTGIEPQWVEPIPVVTNHGTYRGGYYPAKYDTNRSTRALSDEAASNIMDQWRAARGSAKTRDSFTKARADQVISRPLRKDLGVLTQHVTEVTHRLAWQEFLIDAQRLLRAGPIDNAIRTHYGPEVLETMRDAIEDIATGEVPAQNALESVLNYLRTGATIAGLGWRITTSLLQPIGLTQSMARIGTRYVGRGLAEWLGDAARMENTAKRIYAKSDMMRLRGKTMQREINEIRNKVAGRTSAIEASYFYLIQKMQLVADIPTWLGQYHKAVEMGADEETAVALADQAVLDAQGGGQIKDLAAVQRGGVGMKLWTNFYSFFNTTYNLTRESVGRTDFKDPLSIGYLAVDMVLLYTLPAVLGTLLKAALGDELDDEDKLWRRLAADQLTYMFGTMVGLRELAGGLQGGLGLPGDYQGPAAVRFFSEAGKLGKQIGQGEVDEAALKAANNVGGILFHYPAGQVNATAAGAVALAEGRTENPGALLVGAHK